MPNSAERIATLLDEIKSMGRSTGVLSAVMADKLDVADGSSDYLLALSALVGQMEGIRSSIIARVSGERARAVYIRSLDKILPFLHPASLTQLSGGSMPSIENDIDQMFIIADLLGPESEVLTGDELEKAIDQVWELKQQLKEITMDETLRHHLIRIIDTLLMSLRSHHILGAEGVARAFGTVTAEFQRTVNTTQATSPEVSAWYHKTKGVLLAIGAAVVWGGAVAGGGSQLLEFKDDVVQLASPDSDLAAADGSPNSEASKGEQPGGAPK